MRTPLSQHVLSTRTVGPVAASTHALSGTAAVADASVALDSPVYVWPLNPWGGMPFRRDAS